MKSNRLHHRGQRRILARIFTFALGLLAVPSAYAGEIREVYRNTEVQAMGGASIAVVEDEAALYLNPAGLAATKKIKIHLVTADIAFGSELLGFIPAATAAFNHLGPDTLNVLMGKRIYVQGQATPTFMMPNFAFGILLDQQLALYTVNRALPNFTLGYQTTNGAQAGYGVAIKPKGGGDRSEIRLGFAGKMLFRRGGYRLVPVTELTALSQETIHRITGDFGQGFGVDLGAQYFFKVNKILTVSAGVVYRDIGDTNFGSGPDPIKGDLGYGLGARLNMGMLKITGDWDYSHLQDRTDWRKKNHFGLSFGLPFLSVFGGVDQVYLTYGAAVDVWLLRIAAASYAEELDSFVYQAPQRRWSLRVDFKLGF